MSEPKAFYILDKKQQKAFVKDKLKVGDKVCLVVDKITKDEVHLNFKKQ